MKYRYGTFRRSIRRVQTLAGAMKELKAINRAFEQLGDAICADEVVVVEREIKPVHTIDDSLMDVLKYICPDILGLKYVDDFGRRAVVIFLRDSVLSVDWTNLNTGETVRKILQEVLAA